VKRKLLVLRKMPENTSRKIGFKTRVAKIPAKYRKRSQGVQKKRKKYSIETRWLSL
jgi:hypothetical protein